MAALQSKKPANCESCEFYDYDEEYDAYVCLVSLDEDDMCDFLSHNTRSEEHTSELQSR